MGSGMFGTDTDLRPTTEEHLTANCTSAPLNGWPKLDLFRPGCTEFVCLTESDSWFSTTRRSPS